MFLVRSVLALGAALIVVIAAVHVTAYRQAVAAAPHAAALIRAVQQADTVESAAQSATQGARLTSGAVTSRADVEPLLHARAVAYRWWAAAVLGTLALGLAIAPGYTFFRSAPALALPLAVLIGTFGTLWLASRETAAVISVLSRAPADPPGLWRLATWTLLLLTTAGHVAVVGGAVRAWLEQFADAWARAGAALRDGFDRAAATLRRDQRPGLGQPPETAITSTAPATGRSQPASTTGETSFRSLMHREWKGIVEMRARLDRREPDPLQSSDFDVVDTTPADEPFVSFRAADLTGLALSGGGIRSATFNLGLLQGLHRIGLLPRIDYLSTVSGGGYIGSFWSAWLVARRFGDDAQPWTLRDIFPGRARGGATSQLDSEQERHLREFGRFLAPRVGLLEVETWTALVAAIAGLIPAAAIALAMIGMGLVTWLALTVPLGAASPFPGAVTIGAITAGVFGLFEVLWQTVKLPHQDQSGARAAARLRDLAKLAVFSAVGLAMVLALHAMLPTARAWWRSHGVMAATQAAASPGATTATTHISRDACGAAAPDALPVRYVAPQWETICPGARGWWRLTGLSVRDAGASIFIPSLFDYSWVWLGAGLCLLLARLIHPLFPLGEDALWVAPLDRVIMRLLGLATFWAAIAALWHFALNLDSLALSALSAIASAGVFALLRNWIGVALQRPERPGAASRLKPLLPQLLAYVTLLLAFATVGQALIRLCGDDWQAWWTAAAVMLGTLVLGLFIDPAEFGLHAFYRARISRAYAGASNLALGEGAAGNRQTDPRAGDDVPLEALLHRPLHLVCCAANDLNGDDIGTLGRGARSAVLSPHGFALGPFATPRCPPVTLGAAVTASAAAFNSNMGDVSMKLGPAVSFLMTALNLRLGLWLRHPLAHAASSRRWPGLLLYREYLGLTSASGQVVRQAVARHATDGTTSAQPVEAAPRHMRDIHLSDGGHFENLAIYELVRRHCRYILASDCGADPTIAFDDLGRALRRIRQDFGIDISIDVQPLRPDADGRSRQHVAVGRIHYSPTDIGILLYLKPTLTGDELADVLQYKTRNGAFPHEGTGDQFYDEAQWESYRRLGLHVAERVFSFVPPAADPASGVPAVQPEATSHGAGRLDDQVRRQKVTADWVFGEAAARWGTTPGDLEANVLAMTERVTALEIDLQQSGAEALLREVFPELEAWAATPTTASGPTHHPDAPADASIGQGGVELVAILRATQMMEDVWMACDLDTWWSHPLNMGWVNFFARWVTAPTFRFWWPVIGPMYSKGFRDFVDDRFPMPAPAGRRQDEALPWKGRVRRVEGGGVPTGLAATWWATRSAQPCPWRSARAGVPPRAQVRPAVYYENLLTLERPGGGHVNVQVGLASTWSVDGHDETGPTSCCVWTSDDFFVPPSLWGASIGWYFLSGLLNVLAADHTYAYVLVRGPRGNNAHRVAAEDTRNFVDQYRKIGFRPHPHLDDGVPPRVQALLAEFDFLPASDTLFRLHLPRWQASRGDATRPPDASARGAAAR